MTDLLYKLIPHSYTYARPSYRHFEKANFVFKVDISDYLGHSLYFGYDNEESRSYERLFSLVKPGFRCIDVGANIGYVSLMMSAQGDNVTVLGFEPDPVNYTRASENLALNRTDRVEIYNLGLGDKSGQAVIEIRASFNLGGNRVAKPGTNGETISITTLDNFLKGADEPIDLIKIDVEGYEFKVLQGAKEVLKKFHPLLFIEINEDNLQYQGDTAPDLIKFLSGLGYLSFWNTSANKPISEDTDFKGLHFDLLASV